MLQGLCISQGSTSKWVPGGFLKGHIGSPGLRQAHLGPLCHPYGFAQMGAIRDCDIQVTEDSGPSLMAGWKNNYLYFTKLGPKWNLMDKMDKTPLGLWWLAHMRSKWHPAKIVCWVNIDFHQNINSLITHFLLGWAWSSCGNCAGQWRSHK